MNAPCRKDIREACDRCGAKEGEACRRKEGVAQGSMNRLAVDKMHGGPLPIEK